MISKRVKTRMRYYASEGYWVFKPPLGYDLGKDKILIENESSNIVRDIFLKFVNGKSLTQLQVENNTSHSTIKRILTNVAYAGKTKFGFEKKDNLTGKSIKNLEGEVFQGKHKAIVDDELFSLAQIKLKSISVSVVRANASEHILSGLIKHKGCKWKAYIKRASKGIEDSRYYSCQNCYKTIRAKVVEEAVIESAKEYVKSLTFLDNVVKKKKTDISSDKKKKILLGKRERVVNSYIDSNISRDDYLKKIKEIDDELSYLKDEVVVKEEPSTLTLKEKLISMFENFDDKNIFEKKEILKLLIEEVQYEKKEITIIYKV